MVADSCNIESGDDMALPNTMEHARLEIANLQKSLHAEFRRCAVLEEENAQLQLELGIIRLQTAQQVRSVEVATAGKYETRLAQLRGELEFATKRLEHEKDLQRTFTRSQPWQNSAERNAQETQSISAQNHRISGDHRIQGDLQSALENMMTIHEDARKISRNAIFNLQAAKDTLLLQLIDIMMHSKEQERLHARNIRELEDTVQQRTSELLHFMKHAGISDTSTLGHHFDAVIRSSTPRANSVVPIPQPKENSYTGKRADTLHTKCFVPETGKEPPPSIMPQPSHESVLSEVAVLRVLVKERGDQLETLQALATQRLVSLNDAAHRVSDGENRVRALQERVHQLERELSTEREQRDAGTVQIRTYQELISKKEDTIRVVQGKLHRCQNVVQDLRITLDVTMEREQDTLESLKRFDALESRCAQYEVELDMSKKLIQTMQSELIRLKQAVSGSVEESGSPAPRISAPDSRVEFALRHCRDLQTQYQQHLEKMNKVIAVLKDQLKASDRLQNYYAEQLQAVRSGETEHGHRTQHLLTELAKAHHDASRFHQMNEELTKDLALSRSTQSWLRPLACNQEWEETNTCSRLYVSFLEDMLQLKTKILEYQSHILHAQSDVVNSLMMDQSRAPEKSAAAVPQTIHLPRDAVLALLRCVAASSLLRLENASLFEMCNWSGKVDNVSFKVCGSRSGTATQTWQLAQKDGIIHLLLRWSIEALRNSTPREVENPDSQETLSLAYYVCPSCVKSAEAERYSGVLSDVSSGYQGEFPFTSYEVESKLIRLESLLKAKDAWIAQILGKSIPFTVPSDYWLQVNDLCSLLDSTLVFSMPTVPTLHDTSVMIDAATNLIRDIVQNLQNGIYWDVSDGTRMTLRAVLQRRVSSLVSRENSPPPINSQNDIQRIKLNSNLERKHDLVMAQEVTDALVEASAAFCTAEQLTAVLSTNLMNAPEPKQKAKEILESTQRTLQHIHTIANLLQSKKWDGNE